MSGDTLPSDVVAVAGACVSRFTIEGTAKGDLLDLFNLSLMAGHDSVAGAVVKRRLALAADAPAQATVLQETIDGYLQAEPIRVVAAESALARLDAMGTRVQAARITAHWSFLTVARTKFNAPYMRREAERMIALGHEVPADAIKYDWVPLIYAYIALGEISYIEQTDSVMEVMARAKQDLGRFSQKIDFPRHKPWNPMAMFDYKNAPVAKVRNALLPFNAEQYAGKSLPPLAASYWFPNPPGAWPPDHPSLIIYGGSFVSECVHDDGRLLSLREEITGNYCGVLYTYLPRWANRYKGQLAITLVAQTAGNTVRSVVLPPAAEADSLKWFFLDHLKLPITFGMVVDSLRRMPLVDGRVFYVDTTFYGNFSYNAQHSTRISRTGASDLVVLLYGERGTLQYAGGLDTPVLEKLIARTVVAARASALGQEKP
jgi:hypothetical protein